MRSEAMLRTDRDDGQPVLQDARAPSPWNDETGPAPASQSRLGFGERGGAVLRAPADEAPPAAEHPAAAPEADADRALRLSAGAHAPSEKAGGGWLRRRPLSAALGLGALVLVGAAGYLYWDDARRYESTDDAFIAARQFAIAARVSGYVTAVPVTDNEHVAAGDVLARIDDRDYRAALAQAEAQASAAQDAIRNIDAQSGVQEAQVAQSQAQVEQAQAGLVFAQQQAARYEDLAQRGSGSLQNAQQYGSALHQQDAALKTAQAGLAAAQRQIEVLKAQRSSAEANLAQAQAQRDQAELNLSYTTVRAAQPGRMVSLSAGVGGYATPGASLAMFVPDGIWVTANFKETQLDAMRPGQTVALAIDAYPGRPLVGHVASVQPGSGTAFSLLPAENATGNYVKIVQRVPVKITLDDPPADVALGPGMSVAPTVRVDPAPSLYERLRGRQ
jgi:membrane fusion protein (multidrug efflux system)